MTLHEKLKSKLQPHTDRIQDGTNDDFDYLPAVLQHLIEEQKQHPRIVAELVSPVREDIKSVAREMKETVQRGVEAVKEDFKGGVTGIKEEVRKDANEIQKAVQLGVDVVKADLNAGLKEITENIHGDVKAIRKDVTGSSEVITLSLAELKAVLAEQNQKVKRILLVALAFGIVTLGVSIAVLSYVRQ